MNYSLVVFTFISSLLFSQEKIESIVDKQAQTIGGQLDVDNVFRSQVIYPASLLKKNFSQDIAIYFTVSANGTIKDIEFKQEYNEELRTEAKRLLRYFIYTPATISNVNVSSNLFSSYT